MRRAFAIALLQIPATVAFALLALLQWNTLENNGNWRVSKAMLWHPVMGAQNYAEGHEATYRSALDLGKWHGFQEVVLQRPITTETTRVTFDLRLDAGAYVVFLFNRTRRGARALRLSRDERFPSAVIDIEDRFRFGRLDPLVLSRPLDDRWSAIDLEFAGDEMRLRIDDRPEARFRAALEPGTRIGFRGGYVPAKIDDVRVWEGGDVVFREGFFVTRGFWRVAFATFALLSLASALVLASAKRREPERAQEIRFALVGVHLALAVILWITVAGVFLFRGRSHPPAWMVGGRADPEAYFAYMAKPFDDWNERYGAGPAEGTYRILVIGSSQTWGSGTTLQRQAFPAQLQRMLNHRLSELELQGEDGQRLAVEVLNGGARGLLSDTLIGRLYLGWWIDLAPHLVVVNLSNNDPSRTDVFPTNLEALVVANRERGIDTMFVQEARSIETDLRRLRRNHRRMKAVGDDLGVPVVPMHKYMRRRHDDGFLWWDGIHMTSFGYSLLAERLADAIWDEFLAGWAAGG